MTILRSIITFSLISLLLFFFSRSGLVLWQDSRATATDGLLFIFIQGLRFDLVMLGYMLLLPAALTPIFFTGKPTMKVWKPLSRGYFSLCVAFITFMEVLTPSFINEYDARPNFLFVEYLMYPKEVFSTLWGAYKLQIFITFITVPLIAFITSYIIKKNENTTEPIQFWKAALLTPVLLVICFIMARSTTDYRPVNPSTVAFSSDPMVNDLPLNSTYTLLYAIYEERRDNKTPKIKYGHIPRDKIIGIVRKNIAAQGVTFCQNDFPTMHMQQASRKREKPLNLVIILEESLGAEFVGALGGLPLTPNLDKLAAQGIWFEKLYATGTRSIRGIEALISGYPPTPSRSVVKLRKTQRNFFTIASLLRQHGYDTSFIYGGEAHFDNMRRFFMNNGFNWTIDEKDYDNPVFLGSWGVSDEDLFNRAHQEFLKYGDKPFFSLVFTSSNHSPYKFPDGRIDLYDSKTHTVNNAVKYADYALGKFIETARGSDYWHNTVFLIVADHNSRVYGASFVPVDRFHIPGLIIGADIKPEKYSQIASQIDLPPTLLSLIGLSAKHPMTGYDLTKSKLNKIPGRAIMQYGSTQGYMEGDSIVIMRSEMLPKVYKYESGALIESDKQDDNLITKALAHALWAGMAYFENMYHL